MMRFRDYFELVRLPNAFTAMADVLAGYWFVSGAATGSWRLAAMLVASACLYSAGIAINDLRDIAVDRRERPSRPLPSGRVSKANATVLAIVLCVLSLVAATGAGSLDCSVMSIFSTENRSGIVALVLLGAILAYDILLKSTFVGPVLMGACRGLNLLLGMTLGLPFQGEGADFLRRSILILIAFALYATSITYFGRDEAGQVRRRRLVTGLFGIVLSMWMLGSITAVASAFDGFTLILWLALLVHIIRVGYRAIKFPSPPQVQYAMKTFILGFIVFDAIVASASAGWEAGTIVLVMLVPAALSGKWIYST
ncbi:MAG: UbiA family prenyltransferase [Phycisphaerae bacterium]